MTNAVVEKDEQGTATATAGPSRGTALARRVRAGRFPLLRGLTPLLVFLVIWQIVGDYHSPYYPTPHAWWDAVEDLRQQGVFWPAIGFTLRIFLTALLVSTVIGAVLGFVMGRIRLIDRCLGPTTEFIRAIPSAAIVPVLVLIMGITSTTNVVVVVVGTLWPVLLSTRAAIRDMNPLLHDVAGTLRLSRSAWLGKVVLPSLLPSILVGVQVMAPMTLIVTLLVEIVTGTSGVGGLLSAAQQSFVAAQVYGLVCVAGVIALLVNIFVGLIEHYAARYAR